MIQVRKGAFCSLSLREAKNLLRQIVGSFESMILTYHTRLQRRRIECNCCWLLTARCFSGRAMMVSFFLPYALSTGKYACMCSLSFSLSPSPSLPHTHTPRSLLSLFLFLCLSLFLSLPPSPPPYLTPSSLPPSLSPSLPASPRPRLSFFFLSTRPLPDYVLPRNAISFSVFLSCYRRAGSIQEPSNMSFPVRSVA